MQAFKRLDLLAVCGTAALWLTFPSTALSQNANVPVDQLFEDLAGYCDRATEVSYRSRALVSDSGDRQVYVEGLLRKTVDPRSSLRQSDTDGHCYSDSIETLESKLVVEQSGEARRFDIERYGDDTIIVWTPRSFSADGRYLVTDVDVSYSGTGGGSYIQLFDLQSGAVVTAAAWCDTISGEYSSEYLGITAEGEFVVHCAEYGGEREQIEAFNPQTLEIRQLASVPAQLTNYGSVASELAVLQVQRFE
jgi:hypothetical protein